MFGEHENFLFQNENNVVLNGKSVEEKPSITREIESLDITIFYTVVLVNMNLLSVVTTPSIYHCCSTRKTLWEEKFTGEEKLFSAVNMNNCVRFNVRKHKEIKGSEKYVTLDISLKFDSLEKMKIISSDSKVKLERSRKGLITSLGFKAKVRPPKYKKARHAIVNFSKKDFPKIIGEFEKFEKLTYEKKRPKHEPTYSYFYLAIQLVKCMMRADTLNCHDCGCYTEMTDLSSNVYSTENDESKHIIVHKTLLQNYYVSEDESKQSTVNEKILQNYYAEVENLCSTEEDKSEYTIME